MQMADPRRDETRPATGAAAGVEADRAVGQGVPWEDAEITLENRAQLGLGDARLVERRPFLAKALDGWLVEIGHCAALRSAPSIIVATGVSLPAARAAYKRA